MNYLELYKLLGHRKPGLKFNSFGLSRAFNLALTSCCSTKFIRLHGVATLSWSPNSTSQDHKYRVFWSLNLIRLRCGDKKRLLSRYLSRFQITFHLSKLSPILFFMELGETLRSLRTVAWPVNSAILNYIGVLCLREPAQKTSLFQQPQLYS